jgi:hypothetical protein
MYVSRFVNTIANWSKRGVNGNPQTMPRRAAKDPLSLVSPNFKDNVENLKTAERYLLAPGKSKYAGMKPVFYTSSNLLKKSENQIVPTEQHLEFPVFIQTLPKSGLKNNLKEYRNILKMFVKTENKLSKSSRLKAPNKFNSQLTALTYKDFANKIPDHKRQNRSVDRRKGRGKQPKSLGLGYKRAKQGNAFRSARENKMVLERVINKYIQISLKNQDKEAMHRV